MKQVREKLNARREREEQRKSSEPHGDAKALSEALKQRQGDVVNQGISWGMADDGGGGDDGGGEKEEGEEEDLPDYLKNVGFIIYWRFLYLPFCMSLFYSLFSSFQFECVHLRMCNLFLLHIVLNILSM
jgi:hypothetical protein